MTNRGNGLEGVLNYRVLRLLLSSLDLPFLPNKCLLSVLPPLLPPSHIVPEYSQFMVFRSISNSWTAVKLIDG